MSVRVALVTGRTYREVRLGSRRFLFGVFRDDQWSEQTPDGWRYAGAREWLDRLADLEEAARRVIAQMPPRPTPDEDGVVPALFLASTAPIFDAIDVLRAVTPGAPDRSQP